MTASTPHASHTSGRLGLFAVELSWWQYSIFIRQKVTREPSKLSKAHTNAHPGYASHRDGNADSCADF